MSTSRWWTLRVSSPLANDTHRYQLTVYTEFFGRAIGNPAFDWNFQTVPQPALNNASVHHARGKMLGGSSGLNFMAWNRASVKEYDAWDEVLRSVSCEGTVLINYVAGRNRMELEILAAISQEERDCFSPSSSGNLAWRCRTPGVGLRRVSRAVRAYTGSCSCKLQLTRIFIFPSRRTTTSTAT